jgi:signal transduction histidine kinase
MVAHELRQPLTALLGALTTIHQRGPALPISQHHELLAMARRQGAQLQQLLDQLLVLGGPDQPQAGAGSWSLIDVAALSHQAALAARSAHPNHRITSTMAGPLLVRADPLAISRILGNLLDNAAAYSPAGSLIQLVGGRDHRQAVLTVRDHGPGIPADDRDRVFQRAVRLDRQPNRSGGRLGLGLYLARRLAHTSGGGLQATDPPGGHGAQLELRLPLAPLQADPTPPIAPQPGGDHH